MLKTISDCGIVQITFIFLVSLLKGVSGLLYIDSGPLQDLFAEVLLQLVLLLPNARFVLLHPSKVPER